MPKLPTLDSVRDKLPRIFPEGLEHRNYCVRDMAARAIWVMLYVGAIQGTNRWIRPSQITDMGDAQSTQGQNVERETWYQLTLSSRKSRPADAWYAPNSREPIRDETLRQGLIPHGAVVERPDLPVTSSLPRYALETEFSALFDPSLSEAKFAGRTQAWQASHLSKAALARIALLRDGTAIQGSQVPVHLPNGEIRNMQAGPSAVIAKAVIEEFAPRFLRSPALLWLSESGNKVVAKDDMAAKRVGLRIDPSKTLPDIILADLGQELLVVFVEVVASDGPIHAQRKRALTVIGEEAGFTAEQLAFVTAFEDRSSAPARALLPNLAWGSFAWFRSEPNNILILHDGAATPISELRKNGPANT